MYSPTQQLLNFIIQTHNTVASEFDLAAVLFRVQIAIADLSTQSVSATCA